MMNYININATGQPETRCAVRLRTAAIGLVALVMLGASARADMYQPGGITAGGVPAQATITSINTVGTNSTVSWYGMRGWYQVLLSTNGVNYTPVGGSVAASEYAWSNTVNNGGSPFVLSWLVQTNSYAGSGACSGCHGTKYSQWSGTAHAGALTALKNIHQDGNVSCLPCHTVGFGQPTGYTNSTLTPYLTDVGCENCHGPAGWHKNGDHALIRPAVTIAAEVCGGCHNGYNPQYNEWTNSAHSAVDPHFTSGSSDFKIASTGPGNQMNCGPCHSGATRLAMLANYQDQLAGITNYLTLPSGHDAAAYGQTCVVCHDPHTPTFVSTNVVYTTNVLATTNIARDYGIYHTNVYYTTNVTSATSIVKVPYQLRNPMWSSNYFTFFTGTATTVVYYTNWSGVVTKTTNWLNDNFAGQYNPNIQVCAQCHNSRGARWDGIGRTWTGTNFVASAPSFSRAPHNSVQYNILIGILQPDYLNSTNGKTVYSGGPITNGIGIYASHSGIAPRTPYNTNQCSTCHVPIYTSAGANITGHTFQLDENGCALGGCHTTGHPDILGTQIKTTNNLQRVVDLLNTWSTTKATNYFSVANYNKYKQNSWEYTSPGALATVTNAGPSASDQMNLPVAIQQARFNVYMVRNDGSLGVHNPTFIPLLLKDAEAKVLNQFTTAKFTASSPDVAVKATVTFSNWNANVTSCAWNFGDGGTSTSTSNKVTHVYTSVGTWTVSLTATDGSGTETLTRNNYITTYGVPVSSFTYTSGTLTHPVTVNFVNTSGEEYAKWAFYDNSGFMATSNRLAGVVGQNVAFTYTNAGTFKVTMQASNPGGSGNIVTNSIIVN